MIASGCVSSKCWAKEQLGLLPTQSVVISGKCALFSTCDVSYACSDMLVPLRPVFLECGHMVPGLQRTIDSIHKPASWFSSTNSRYRSRRAKASAGASTFQPRDVLAVPIKILTIGKPLRGPTQDLAGRSNVPVPPKPGGITSTRCSGFSTRCRISVQLLGWSPVTRWRVHAVQMDHSVLQMSGVQK